MSIRLLWRGQADWDLLIVNYLEVARKGMYQAVWKDIGAGFVINLIKPGLFSQLEPEEKEGISFGGQPLRQINAQVKKTSMTGKLLDKLENSILKRYKEFFLPWNRILLMGLILSGLILITAISLIYKLGIMGMLLLLFVTSLFIFVFVEMASRWSAGLFSFKYSDFTPKKVSKAIIMPLLDLLFTVIALAELNFVDHKKDTTDSFATQREKMAIILIIILMGFITTMLNDWIFFAFYLSIIGQLMYFSNAGNLSPKGIAMRAKLKAYRAELAKQPYKYPDNTPLWLALDIPCNETHLISPLLT